MKWLNGYRITAVLVGIVATVVPGGVSAKADFTFGEPTIVEAPINEDYRIRFVGCITADNLQLYLDQHVGTWNSPTRWDIMVSTRSTTSEPWPKPVSVGAAVNNGTFNYNAAISNDGLKLYFDSARSGGHGGADIWVTTRPHKGANWGTPLNLGPPFNTSSHDGCVCISSNGLEFYFSTNRAGGWDIWVSKRQTQHDDWGTPENLGAPVNTNGDEFLPGLSPDGLILFFCDGTDNMCMSRRKSTAEPWQASVRLGYPLNSSKGEFNPRVSPDGRILYFTSYRPGVYKLEGKGWHVWQAAIDPIVDFTGDGIVDLREFAKLAQYWGQNEPSFDIGPMPWGNGIVDVQDLAVLAEHWLGGLPSLVAHWKLDETEGGIAHDSIGGKDGYGAPDLLWRPDGGKVGGALELDGIDDFLCTTFSLNPAQRPFSVFLWVKGGLPGEAILSQAGGVNWLFTVPSLGWLSSGLGQGGWLASQIDITDGQWHRIGFTWDGTNRRLYVDGVQAARDTLGPEGADGRLYFGAGKDLEPGTFWTGLIDDVRIYDRAIQP